MSSFERAIQDAFLGHTRGDKGRADELAQMLGMSTSHLYRACNPDDDGAHLRLMSLLPFMRLTKNFGPLRWLARACGFVVVALPKRPRAIGPDTVAAVQRDMLDMTKALLDYNDGAASRADALDAVYAAIEKLIIVQKTIERDGELPIEEGQRCLRLQ
jgi:hypothetical protein